jgi:hypothetical protein
MRWEYREETYDWVKERKNFMIWLNENDRGTWEPVGYHFYYGMTHILFKRRIPWHTRTWRSLKATVSRWLAYIRGKDVVSG